MNGIKFHNILNSSYLPWVVFTAKAVFIAQRLVKSRKQLKQMIQINILGLRIPTGWSP